MPAVSKIELIAALGRESFFDFVQQFWHVLIPEKPVWNWHIEYLCDEMQRLAERVFLGLHKEYDLVINISPGTSKSTICSIMFPAWVWTRMLSARCICGSYSYPLAMDLSRKSRDVVISDLYGKCYPEVLLRVDQNTKGYYANTKGGYRYAVGVNGSVTGMHGHFLIIDDPLDPNQAVSTLELEAANHWLQETLPTRKVDKRVTPTILIMQRLHQDDPTNLFLERKNVKHICLPGEVTEDIKPAHLIKYYSEDKLFDPIRLPQEVLEEMAQNLGEYGYAGQVLQNPVPKGGGKFKTKLLKEWDPAIKQIPWKSFRKIVRYWDKAGTHLGGAWTVGVLMAHDIYGFFWVLDVVRVQVDSWEREVIIRETAAKDGKNVIVVFEQEPGSGGKESAYNSARSLPGFKTRIHKVGASDGSKLDRADSLSSMVNAGSVYIVKKPWNKEYVEEMKHFPHSRYKDQVDASSGAFNNLWKMKRHIGGMRSRAQLDALQVTT
jgi:predicted phage terminase large subunit-like protein